MPLDTDSYAALAVQTAQEAGTFLREHLHRDRHIEFKGEINLVTEADRMSEEMIASRIRAVFPDHGLVMEESPEVDTGSPFRWIIDPLDGTTNYAHRFPVFCVSIALEYAGEILLGVIYNPMMNEMFVARKGQGAMLNGERIRVSDTAAITRSLLATGFPYDIRESRENNIDYFITMAKRAQAIRRAGSAALDLAYVAAGRFDGFWELKLMPWDTAAGCLMVLEAGGRVTDLQGEPFTLDVPHMLASNGRIHEEMIGILQEARQAVNSK